jgi:hypothetical protein
VLRLDAFLDRKEPSYSMESRRVQPLKYFKRKASGMMADIKITKDREYCFMKLVQFQGVARHLDKVLSGSNIEYTLE